MAKAAPPSVRYRLAFPDPKSHLVSVEMRIAAGHPEPLSVAMAAWTPGSYKVRDFARHVQDVSVTDERGRKLAFEKTDKQTWRITATSRTAVLVRYRVYANELGVRTSVLDDRHAHLNGASLFLYVPELTKSPVEVTVEAPRGWKVAAALESRGKGRYVAADFDALVDGPIQLGVFDEAHFRERGVPHRVVLSGVGRIKAVDLVPDLQKIVRAGAALWGPEGGSARAGGGLPYKDYTFFINLASEPGGGLEHKSSCSLIVARDGFAPRERYLEFLLLAAHEHFHAWNVKRLRPQALGPFDYRGERYTRMLWVAEGFTSYYEKLLLLRAGLASAEEILALFAEKIRTLRETPGRAVQSVADASFDAWIRYYQPSEHSPNVSVSYYHKGQLIGLLLDLEIRRRTRGRRSLDDVMRRLYASYAGAHGYPDAALREAAEAVAGGSLGGFFGDYVDGVAELDFEAALSAVGLQLIAEDDDPPTADLGVLLDRRRDAAILSTVLTGGPGAKAGLDARDEIVAWDGVRVDRDKLEKRLAAHRPAERVQVTVFRADLLRQFDVVLGRKPPRKLRIAPKKTVPRTQRALYERWMNPKA